MLTWGSCSWILQISLWDLIRWDDFNWFSFLPLQINPDPLIHVVFPCALDPNCPSSWYSHHSSPWFPCVEEFLVHVSWYVYLCILIFGFDSCCDVFLKCWAGCVPLGFNYNINSRLHHFQDAHCVSELCKVIVRINHVHINVLKWDHFSGPMSKSLARCPW